METPIQRARLYAQKIDPAVSGSGGHTKTFKCATALVRKFGAVLDEDTLYEVFSDWNATCSPQWNEKDLHHKLKDALKRVTPEPYEDWAAKDLESWPDLRNGTDGELEKLSQLRGFSIAGLQYATERGSLKFARWRDRLAWFVCDLATAPGVCEGRRLDGQPWSHGGKTWTVTKQEGAAKRALGLSAIIEGRELILMTEGSADWIAGLDLQQREQADDFAVLTVLGASYWLDDFTIEALAGKPVAIFSHQDQDGRKALRKWGAQLAKRGCQIFAGWSLPRFKNFNGDLNDYLKTQRP